MLKLITQLWYLWVLIVIAFLYGIFKPKIKGFIGEKTVAAILSRLEPTKYRVINDVMLDVEGKTSQIDHLVISDYGIFVIETKNYKGWIIGEEHSEYWTQLIYKRKEKLYNPIRQNYGHIQALKHHLKEFNQVRYIPIIVFSVNADLKVKTTSHVIYSVNLLKTIRSYSDVIISEKEKEDIFEKITSLNIRGKDVRTQHVEVIQRKKEDRQELIEKNICPKCGGNLILRNGKSGKFKGCSNFPKCRFTHNS